MAQVRLAAGASCDIVSSSEMKQMLDSVEGAFFGMLTDRDGDTQTFVAAPVETDGNGKASIVAYKVSQAYRAYLLRLQVDYEGSDFSNAQSCNLRVVADADTPSALRTGNNQVPSVYEEGRNGAALFQAGQDIVVTISGGPTSTNIYVSGQVLLVPIRPRLRSVDTQRPAT